MAQRPGEAKRIVTLGEALVDMLPVRPPSGTRSEGPAYLPAPGGAPANVAVGVARLGASAGFIGKVGDDPFGDLLERTLVEEGVDVRHLSRSADANTALAFVTLGRGGERSFHFYRERAADLQLTESEVDPEYVRSAAFLHVGSLSLTAEPSRGATLAALEHAERGGVARSVDPNLRLDQWPDAATARREVLALVSRATLVKLTEEELEFLTLQEGERGARSLVRGETELLLVTRGERGVTYFTPDATGSVAGFVVTPLDTTGAGDAFMAAVLVGLAERAPIGPLSGGAALEEVLTRANAFAALTVTGKGAISAMPTADQLSAFLAQAPGRRS